MPDVYGNLLAFSVLFLTGGLCGLFYDLLRALTSPLRMRSLLIVVRDLLFWVLVGCFLCFVLVQTADGRMRGAFLLSAVGGSAAYFLMFSPVILPPMCRLARSTHSLILRVARCVAWIANLPVSGVRGAGRRGATLFSGIRGLWAKLGPARPRYPA